MTFDIFVEHFHVSLLPCVSKLHIFWIVGKMRLLKTSSWDLCKEVVTVCFTISWTKQLINESNHDQQMNNESNSY